MQHHQQVDAYGEGSTQFSIDQFTDFLNDPEDYSTSNNDFINNTAQIDYITSSFESCLTKKDGGTKMDMQLQYKSSNVTPQTSSNDSNSGVEDSEEEGNDLGGQKPEQEQET